MGRFTSPDWSASVAPIPYVDLDDPQSLNLYTYVGNRPVSSVDPDGHDGSEQENGDRAWLDEHAPEVVQAEREGEFAASGSVRFDQEAQQQSTTQTPDNTLEAQNNTPPPPGRTPAQGGTPGSTVEIPDGKGGKTVRKFGPDGKAETDIDHGHDHGAGDPHAHDWDWGKKPPRQPGRPLTPEEQKNVKRAAGGVTAGVIIYWVVSEASRILFPPRNLIPVL